MRTVDVSLKPQTLREARAYGRIRLKPQTVERIKRGEVPKGNLMEATKLSGIMGAKKTGELLPFCHPIEVDHVEIELKLGPDYLEAFSLVRGVARTGYEMEALTAVSVALLNVYDMCKGFDDTMVIEEVKLISKRGGKSEWWKELKGVKAKVHSENEELGRLAEEYLKKLGAEFSDNAQLYVSIGENIPAGAHLRGFESVVALYDFARSPSSVGKEIKVAKTDDFLIVVLPEDEGKVRFFFETFGGLLGHLL
ncbi:MAG: cyclic pyranopterin monophosphate synthase MoaC [Aquificae bacterium]|nr:cyclic pyranopterin monophosphate synthase MoaC [Aquificota bacterium]